MLFNCMSAENLENVDALDFTRLPVDQINGILFTFSVNI